MEVNPSKKYKQLYLNEQVEVEKLRTENEKLKAENEYLIDALKTVWDSKNFF